MSEENVELVKRFDGCWSRGDLWVLPELCSDEVEFVWSAKLASVGEGGPFHGREGGIHAMRSRRSRAATSRLSGTARRLTASDSRASTSVDDLDVVPGLPRNFLREVKKLIV